MHGQRGPPYHLDKLRKGMEQRLRRVVGLRSLWRATQRSGQIESWSTP